MKQDDWWVRKHKMVVAGVVIILLAAVVYLNILPNPFIWSEMEVVMGGAPYRDLGNIPKFFTTEYWLKEDPFAMIHVFRPIRAVTFTVEYALWKYNPLPYHVFNILIHVVTTLLVFLLTRKILKRFWPAVLTAAFFAVHPIHTEAVTWTMSRDDILSTLFPLVSWWFFIKRLANPAKQWLYLPFEMVFFGLGLLSREMAMVFPVLLGVYVVSLYPKEKWKEGLVATLPYWTINLLYMFYHFYFWWDMIKGERIGGSLNLPWLSHLFLVVKTVGFYVWLMLFPVKLAADWYFPYFVTFQDEWVVGSLIMLFVLGVLTVIFYKVRWREAVFAVGVMILGFLPVANIILVLGRPFGEQRAYLPSIGFCLLLAIILEKILAKEKKVLVMVGMLVIGMYGVRTWQRNYDWRSPLTLWESNKKISPNTERARRNLAATYAALGWQGKAISEYETILNLQRDLRKREARAFRPAEDVVGKPLGPLTAPVALKPVTQVPILQEAVMRNQIGNSYQQKGDFKRAVQEYNAAIAADPRDFLSYNDLGVIYSEGGFYDKAVANFQRGIMMNPNFYLLHENLAATFEKGRRYEEAVSASKQVIKLAPLYPNAYLRLVKIYGLHLKDKEEAKENWDKYLAVGGQVSEQLADEMKGILD